MDGPPQPYAGRKYRWHTFPLPVQDVPNVVCLPLTNHYLKGITERHQPSLAAHGAHLPHMIHVYDRIAVDALEGMVFQAVLDRAQRLRRQQTALGGDDPNQFAVGLKRQNFIRIEEEILGTVSTHHFARLVSAA